MVWLIACVAVDEICRYSYYKCQNNDAYNGNTIESPVVVVVDWKFLHDTNF